MTDTMRRTESDGNRMVSLRATNSLTVEGRHFAAGEVFDVKICEAGAVLGTGCAQLADDAKRHATVLQILVSGTQYGPAVGAQR